MTYAERSVVPEQIVKFLAPASIDNILAANDRRGFNNDKQYMNKNNYCFSKVSQKINSFAPWIGELGIELKKPDAIVTGICLAKNSEEREYWKKFGMSIEAVSGLDFAAQIAQFYKAKLYIWIPDREYALEAGLEDKEQVKLLYQIADNCKEFISERYQTSTILRSSDEEIAAKLNKIVNSQEMASLYPQGVDYAFSMQCPNYWNQHAFMSTVASLIFPSVEYNHQSVYVILDHDQLRSIVAAKYLIEINNKQNLNGLIYWPAPNIYWSNHKNLFMKKLSNKGNEFFIRRIHELCRRMYKSKEIDYKIHINEDSEKKLEIFAKSLQDTNIQFKQYSLVRYINSELDLEIDNKLETPQIIELLRENLEKFKFKKF